MNDDQIRAKYHRAAQRRAAKAGVAAAGDVFVPPQLPCPENFYSERMKKVRGQNPPLLILGNPGADPFTPTPPVYSVNPPRFIVVDSISGVVQYTKVATGSGDAALRAAGERAQDMADKLGRSFIVFLDLAPKRKIGDRMNIEMVRALGFSYEYHPRRQGSSPSGWSHQNPLNKKETLDVLDRAYQHSKTGTAASASGKKLEAASSYAAMNEAMQIAQRYGKPGVWHPSAFQRNPAADPFTPTPPVYGVNPYAQSEADFIWFLENTLIPDLIDSGSESLAEDFQTGLAHLRGKRGGARFANWLETTLIPDLRDSGTVYTAKDFARLASMLKRQAKRGKNPAADPFTPTPPVYGVNPIHGMSGSDWKKATPAQKAHWLRNQISFLMASGSLDPLGQYWLGQYQKKLAQIERKRGKNPSPFMDGMAGGLGFGLGAAMLANSGRGARPVNPSSTPPASLLNDPAFQRELAVFRKRHGKDCPVEIFRVKVPKGFPKFMTAYGQAPVALYDAHRKSKKGKRIHHFGEGKAKGKKPWLVSSADRGNKFLAYVGGGFEARPDWLYY